MVKRLPLLLAAALCAAAAAPADSRPRDRDQDAAFKATKQGRFLPLPMIESRIIPRMGEADYLGPELDAAAGIYRLKFMRGAQVIWVDVDAHTGRVVGQSGR